MSRPRNCRHCSFLTCGDANWCSERNEVMSDLQINASRRCPMWEWNPMDALTLDEWSEQGPKSARVNLVGQLRMELR